MNQNNILSQLISKCSHLDQFTYHNQVQYSAPDGALMATTLISIPDNLVDTLQSDLEQELCNHAKAFLYDITCYYEATRSLVYSEDEFQHRFTLYAFKDQPTAWLTITGTDESVMLTLCIYPQ